MIPTQGVMFNQCVNVLLPGTWFFAPQHFQLHLFVSDDTPKVTDDPLLDYTEASGPNYSAVDVSDGFLQNLGGTPNLYAIIGAVFSNIGPLTPGDDTAFGWWIDGDAGGATRGMYGGRFAAPLVVNMAGQSVAFDAIELPLHDCNTIPFQSTNIPDPWFQTPIVTGVAPNNFNYAPSGGDWTYTFGGGGSGAGVAGVGSFFAPPNPFPASFQVAFIQNNGTISQTIFVPAGRYAMWIIAANRSFGGAQSVQVTLGSINIGTISAWPAAYQLFESSNFVVPASDTYTLTFTGLVPPGPDVTMFLAHVELLPRP